MTDRETIQAHWNQRARLGVTAGTQDLILAELERRALDRAFSACHPNMALEIGCGRGETAKYLMRHRLQSGWEPMLIAVDYSENMIAAAIDESVGWANLQFFVDDIWTLPLGLFDCIYTQRCLINLPTWDDQQEALRIIADRLRHGGRYLMCEHSQDGLDVINAWRHSVDLPAIAPPWHNRYMTDRELATVTALRLVDCRPFSSTYYFLSRIVNARLAADRGQAPAYDDPINRLALILPSEGPWAQGRLWIWEKP